MQQYKTLADLIKKIFFFKTTKNKQNRTKLVADRLETKEQIA